MAKPRLNTDFTNEIVKKKIVQVDLSEFVKLCLLDKSLGDSVMKIFRAVISKI